MPHRCGTPLLSQATGRSARAIGLHTVRKPHRCGAPLLSQVASRSARAIGLLLAGRRPRPSKRLLRHQKVAEGSENLVSELFV